MEPTQTTKTKKPKRIKRLIDGRMFQRFQYDHRRSRKCRNCPGFTFNGGGVCTGCLNGVPVPDVIPSIDENHVKAEAEQGAE